MLIWPLAKYFRKVLPFLSWQNSRWVGINLWVRTSIWSWAFATSVMEINLFSPFLLLWLLFYVFISIFSTFTQSQATIRSLWIFLAHSYFSKWSKLSIRSDKLSLSCCLQPILALSLFMNKCGPLNHFALLHVSVSSFGRNSFQILAFIKVVVEQFTPLFFPFTAALNMTVCWCSQRCFLIYFYLPHTVAWQGQRGFIVSWGFFFLHIVIINWKWVYSQLQWTTTALV